MCVVWGVGWKGGEGWRCKEVWEEGEGREERERGWRRKEEEGKRWRRLVWHAAKRNNRIFDDELDDQKMGRNENE